MSEDPALLQQQFDYADLAAKTAYQQALIRGQTEHEAVQLAIAAADNTLKGLQMVTQLQGPRNAFQQQAMEVGLNNAGYSRAFDALTGRYNMPAFGQQFAPAQATSMNTIAQDMQQAGATQVASDPISQVMNQLFAQLGWGSTPSANTGSAGGYGNVGASPSGGATSTSTSSPTSTSPTSTSATTSTSTPTYSFVPNSTQGSYAPIAPTGTGTGSNAPIVPTPPPTSYMPNTAQVQSMLSALPAPNKIDPRAWDTMSPDTKQFLLGAFSTAGQSPTDVSNTINQIRPQFRAPTFGSITGG